MATTHHSSMTALTGNNPASGTWTLPTAPVGGWSNRYCAIFWFFARANIWTLNAPANMTQKLDGPATTAGIGRIYVFYRWLQSGDTTFGWTRNVASSNADVVWGVDVFDFGATGGSGDPFIATSGASVTEDLDKSTGQNPPAATATASGEYAWTIIGKNNDFTGTPTAPTGYTRLASGSSTAGQDGSAATAGKALSAAGSEDPGTWTFAGGAATDDSLLWTGILKALAAAQSVTMNLLANAGSVYSPEVDQQVAAQLLASAGQRFSPSVRTEIESLFIPSGRVIFEEHFNRVEADAWANGWTLDGAAANFDVDGSVGTIVIPTAGFQRGAWRTTPAVRDSDRYVKIKTDKMADAQLTVFICSRSQAVRHKYQLEVELFDDSTVGLQFAKHQSDETYVSLGSAAGVLREVYQENTWYWVRFQTVGVNPTTLRAKIWREGTPEPLAWDHENTDSEASLQVAGGHDLRAFYNAAAFNAPMTISYEDLIVYDIGHGFEHAVSIGTAGSTVVMNALADSIAVPSPTVSPGGVSVVAQLLSNGRVIYSPTVVPGGVTVVAQLLSNGRVVYSPTVSPGGVSVVAQLIANARTVYSPVVLQQVAMNLLANARSVNSPSITAVSTVVAQLITNLRSIFNPTVSPGGVNVVAQLLANARNIYSPSVLQTVVAQLIANARSIYNPEVDQQVVAQLIANARSVNSPVVAPGAVSVVAQLLSNPPLMFNPTISPGAVQVVAQLIANGRSVFNPSVRQSVIAQLITQAPVVIDPVIYPTNTVVSVHLANAAQLFSPSVSPGAVTVEGVLLVNAVSLHQPSISVGGLFVEVAELDHGPQLHDPSITPGAVTVEAELLENVLAVNNPTIHATSAVAMELIDQVGVAYSPSLHLEVLAELLSNDSNLFDPDVTSGVSVLVPLIDVTPLIYDADVLPGAVTIEAELIDAIAQAFTPDVDADAAPGQQVDVDPLTVVPQAPSPTVLAGMVTVQAHHLARPPSVYAPGITQDQLVEAQLIATAIQAHAPDLTSVHRVLVEQLDHDFQLYTPDTIPGGITVQAGELIVITQVGNPRVFVGIVPTNYQWGGQTGFAETIDDPLRPQSDMSSTQEDSPPVGQDDFQRSRDGSNLT